MKGGESDQLLPSSALERCDEDLVAEVFSDIRIDAVVGVLAVVLPLAER
jgi:hypothetical protein